MSPAGVMGAVFNLNHPAHTVDWHFIHLSVANVVVIGLMLVVFLLAILLPFHGAARQRTPHHDTDASRATSALRPPQPQPHLQP